MLKFVLPGYYLLISRLKAPWAIVSWFVMYPLSASLGALYFAEETMCSRLIVFSFAFMAGLSFYEMGYIGNDYAAICGESGGGTQRLKPSDASVLYHSYRNIVLYKGGASLLLCMLTALVAMSLGLKATISVFVAALVLMYLTFLVHNHVRSRWSIATFMVLSCLKYVVFIFIFPVRSTENMMILIITEIVLIPLLRTIEYSTKGRFHLVWCSALVGNLDWFRVKYYIAIVSICTALYAMHQRYVKLLLVLSVIMVIFRIVTLILSVRLELRNKEMIGVSISDQQGES